MSEFRSADRRRAKTEIRRRRASQRVVVGDDRRPVTEQELSHQSADLSAGVDAGQVGSAERPGSGVAEPADEGVSRAPVPVADHGVEEARGSAPAPSRRRLAVRPGDLVAAALDLLRRPVTLALTLLIAVALVTTAVLGWQVWDEARVGDARTSGLAAGRSSIQKVLSYDHRHLDRDFAAAAKTLTPSFRKKYGRTTDDVVGPTARQYKAVVKANITNASVVRAEADQVVLLMFVNTETTSNRLDGPKVDLARVRVTLVEQDGTWLVDDVDAL